ncbi:anti-sigma factor [Fodinibius sp.]|uniref:anti-sigma factor family protein n=1 Tax=Fodinibius sp. TaxID=1872440 RepID=UPI00356AB091
MKITRIFIKKLVTAATKTRPDEIGCDDCFEQLHEFAEMKLEGKSPEEAMPLVEDHLKRCGECREEYEALLEALKNTQAFSE